MRRCSLVGVRLGGAVGAVAPRGTVAEGGEKVNSGTPYFPRGGSGGRLPLPAMGATVTAVAAGPRHEFSKPPRERIRLVEGLGVEGDAHAGATVKHRSRAARDPTQP